MSLLALYTVSLGAAAILLRMPFIWAPGWARQALYAFPRNRWAGGVLTAIDLAWVTWLLINLHLGWFEPYKMALYLAAPVAWILLFVFMDELLAVRALGGLFILMPTPLLEAARWHPSPARYVMIVIAYAMVIVGVVYVAQPHRFRRWARFFLQDRDEWTRWFGLAGVLAGSLLVILGLVFF